ncbi:16S rRNA (cytidine(1402)-2'-O)-methyltransferase [Candidatus Azambacteria bacterium]|nr:16S rRNA (cytidine(1402)-2'-O)-methyltransferase [Candidatus Azambacteria bacterium]
MAESIPTLYLIATPIGNLEDITMRAVRVLREVDLVLCEDTRVTRKLLSAYDIKKPLESYHQHSTPAKLATIGDVLESGKNIAFVSDAGTPGISDPGGMLVRAVVQRFGDGVRIVPIPGANAALAALSVSGFFTDRFRFLGFPPHKKGRKTFFRSIAEIPEAVVLYESKYRIEKALEELEQDIGERQIVVARELTKQFESIYRGTPSECLLALKNDDMRGEFVVVISPIKT